MKKKMNKGGAVRGLDMAASKANAKSGAGRTKAAARGDNRNAKGYNKGGAVRGLDMAATKANEMSATGRAQAGGGGYAGQGKAAANASEMGMSKGRGKPMTYKSGGRVTRGDGIAQRGHTRGKLC